MPPLGDALSGSTLPPTAPSNGLPQEEQQVSWLWLLLSAFVVAATGAYAFMQRRKRAPATAGDEAFARALEPVLQAPLEAPIEPVRAAPQSEPTLAAAAAQEVADLGFVSVKSRRMRPRLEVAFRPVAATLDDDNFVLEFELGLFNGGNRDARAILVEASFFNADRDQHVAIERFFDNPAGLGDRVVSLGASKRMAIRNKIVTPRANVRVYESDGRQFFVPIIAFNALYRWGDEEGQTSASYIVGRRTEGEKMAPLRVDLGARNYGRLGRKPLPTARLT